MLYDLSRLYFTTIIMKHSRAKPSAHCTSLSFASKPETVQLAVSYNMLYMHVYTLAIASNRNNVVMVLQTIT